MKIQFCVYNRLRYLRQEPVYTLDCMGIGVVGTSQKAEQLQNIFDQFPRISIHLYEFIEGLEEILFISETFKKYIENF